MSNGLNPGDNAEVRALANEYDVVNPAFGLYPVDAVLQEMTPGGAEYPRAPGEWSGEEGTRWVKVEFGPGPSYAR